MVIYVYYLTVKEYSMNTVREIVSSVVVDEKEAKAHLIEHLVNEAVAKSGNLIRKPHSCATWEEAFTVNGNTLSFWYDTEDESTHCTNVCIKEVM